MHPIVVKERSTIGLQFVFAAAIHIIVVVDGKTQLFVFKLDVEAPAGGAGSRGYW